MSVRLGDLSEWDAKSTYIKLPPYFENMSKAAAPLADIHGARVLAVLGDSITTDHIFPAGSIGVDSPAGKNIISRGGEGDRIYFFWGRGGKNQGKVGGTVVEIPLENKI